MQKVKIYSDGSARCNPNGPGGYGAVVQYIDSSGQLHQREFSGGFQLTTNNRMELMAAIIGIESLTKPCAVELFTDSRYLTEAFNQNWIEGWQKKGWKNSRREAVKNSDLWKRLIVAVKPHQVTYEWVKGHDGNPLNERCDELAKAAAAGEAGELMEDEGRLPADS
ncbi:MAG: ribonuclease HI [Lachnospiraceae bacterium]|jgi:ribonuclease HI|nr:ribonuclease HI [Lachnospiraceae bacterium]